jgi:formylmethanofuran dehydrogenase subunit E
VIKTTENGFRDKETLTKKDMVFAAVNVLATEDKRRLNGVERREYVLTLAEALYDWVVNGRAEKGPVRDSIQCDYCGDGLPESAVHQWLDGSDLKSGCKRCFEVHGTSVYEDRDDGYLWR